MKYIIGISAYYHDSAVCLFKNGNLVFACEEERFSGVKHDSRWPVQALDYIFQEYNIKKEEIEAVCYYEDPKLKLNRVVKNIRPQIFNNLKFSINSYLNAKANIKDIHQKLRNLSPNVFYSTHHKSHLYYSYYTSPYKNAICISVDGVGEIDTIATGESTTSGELTYQSMAEYPHSLGLFYAAMTSFLGFKPNEGEYKVMGLASYGTSEKFLEPVRSLINFENGELKCNMDVFIWNKSDKIMFNEKLSEMLGIENRLPSDEITQEHKDLALAVQTQYENILFTILDLLGCYDDPLYSKNLCLGGGCAYNGSANGKITHKTAFNHIWIPSAPSDAGSCIGACVHYLAKNGKMKGKITQNPFLGPIYENYDIEKLLKKRKVQYSRNTMEKIIHIVACNLKKGKVVGWYQGHMEFGARALGNRSILADPTQIGMKDRINKVIKRRENFRPFAPMVVQEKQNEFFEMVDDIPYMNQVVKVKPEYRNKLTEVTHIDGTARVQTVYKNTNMHNLLLEFEKLSGVPILLNTSFNVKDKTMVLTPENALDTFYDTDMDVLVMNNFIIYKKDETI